MGLRHGALKLLESWRKDEATALAYLDNAADKIRYNPDYAIAQIRKAQDVIRRCGVLRDEELPPMLQKTAPALEQRVDGLQQTIDDLSARLARLERGAYVRMNDP